MEFVQRLVSHMEKIFYTMYAVNPRNIYYLRKDVSRSDHYSIREILLELSENLEGNNFPYNPSI